jgi:hypothetical protein
MTAADRLRRARQAAGSAPVAIALLVGANLIPLAGVLVLGWDLLTVLVLYWLENGIVGVFNVLRMAFAGGTASTKLTLIPFFSVHYGIFWVVHGVFVFLLPQMAGVPAAAPPAGYLAVGALALAASHGASFVANYLGRGEYRTASTAGLLFAPYGRLVVLHLTIVLGAFLILELGSPVAVVALLVVLKTAFDLGLHLREHRAAARRATAGTPLTANRS